MQTPTERAATPVSSVTAMLGGVGRVGHGPHQTRQEVAHAVRSNGPLHRAKVRRPRPPPGDLLDPDGIADRFDGAHHGDQDEDREQGPE